MCGGGGWGRGGDGDGGGGVRDLNRVYVAITLTLSSAQVYTQHLFSPRERFLTHQCNISENIKNQTNSEMKLRWLKCWSKGKPTVGIRWVRPEPEHQAPTDLLKSLKAEAVIESEAWPADVQPKREAKLLTVIGLTTMHAVCRITFMLYPIFIYRRMILRNCVLKPLQAYIYLNLYTKSP